MTTPEEDWIVSIEIPLELFIALIVTGLIGRPLGSFSTVTDTIEDPDKLALSKPESIKSPLSVLTQIKSGAEV